jgi:hypothetical protein
MTGTIGLPATREMYAVVNLAGEGKLVDFA